MKLLYAIEVGNLGTNQNDIESEIWYFFNQSDALIFADALRELPFPPHFVKQRVYPMQMTAQEAKEAIEIYKGDR